MKYYIAFFLFMITTTSFAQTTRKIVKDFDGDLKKDSIFIDSDKDILVLWLSTQKYKRIESKEIRYLNFGNTLVATKRGFEFWNDYDRSAFVSVFEYSKTAKKMQLVQMRRTDDILRGDFPGEKTGTSTLNLLTHKYVGVFKKGVKGKVVKMPVINAEIVYPKTYLETYSDAINFDYQTKCIALYEKNKK
ncbi:hypothetical protein [Pedobacter jamesrossensis]|uniref:Uncharacterized protein n=1 Tax=Pedobacter jamesrossensis TaxID=1908238 RepID=A0ABV8NKB0_9SPHI